MLFIYLLMAVVGVLAMIFAVQNPDPVAVRFLHWRIADLPLTVQLYFRLTGMRKRKLRSISQLCIMWPDGYRLKVGDLGRLMSKRMASFSHSFELAEKVAQ